MNSETESHLRTLTFFSVLSRVLVAVLVASSAYLLPLFDSSPRLVLDDATHPLISSLLRWDVFHFALVAQEGYAYEHTWAFLPALPFTMRWSGRLLSYTGLGAPGMAAPLLGGAVLAALFDATRVLYRLSLHHLRSPSAAFLAAALSLLSTSPAALRFAPYTEPFFTYCSYQGMWACTRARWLVASVWFALASAFRSNGILLSGFVLWGMLIEPCLSVHKDVRGATHPLTPARVVYAIALAMIPFIPFGYHNYTGYRRFCVSASQEGGGRAAWCDGRVFPSIYAHVQDAYWNVGFLRYWTVSNVPNIVLALPVLVSVYAFCACYLGRAWRVCLDRWRGGKMACPTSGSLFVAPGLLPYVLHALALTLLLTFNAHVQIALRVLPSTPVVHWAGAWLVIERPKWGRGWVTWSVVWGATSCVLWAVFLPPA